ncbi:MAG TPA: alpha/beta hydrolase, partial [Vicinamibacterales bacterium]
MESVAHGDLTQRLDPALRHLASARTDLSADVLAPTRASLNERRRRDAQAFDTAGVDTSDLQVVVDAQRSVPIRIYRGSSEAGAPAVIYCHAGAFVLGNLDTDHRQCIEFARRAECVVISVDYRLAPEHPYPAALNDVLAVLAWVVAGTGELGIDVNRLAVAGNSAGGALAARVAQCAAEGFAPPLVFQLLHQPVLDDRPSPSKEEFAATPGFDGAAAAQMWRYYLGAQPNSSAAVPGATSDLTGIAPTLIT